MALCLAYSNVNTMPVGKYTKDDQTIDGGNTMNNAIINMPTTNMKDLVAFICDHYCCTEAVALYDYIAPFEGGAVVDLDNVLLEVIFEG